MLRREVTGARISDIFKIELDEILSRHTTGKEKIKNKNVKMRGIIKIKNRKAYTPGLPLMVFSII